jgi:cobalt-zinc-cadmium efflux system outer membrane protein
MKALPYITVLYFLFLLGGNIKAQDGSTTSVTLSYAEGKDRLLKENLQLLAEYYNIEIAEAQIEQAKLWNNPLFVWNAEMYNVAMNKYFAFRNQKLIQLEYAFTYSGKRVNAIRQANLGKEIAELAFADVVRGMIAEFSNQYYSLNALREKERIYQVVLAQFDDVIELSTIKLNLGVTSESDLLRLQTEHLSLQTYLNEIRREIFEVEAQLKTLLNLDPGASINTKRINYSINDNMNIQAMVDSAFANRPDFLIAQKNIDLSQLVYKGAKKESYPAINLGYQPFDQGSNHVRPYHGMVFEMNLPLFDRNQGNIQAAKVGIEQSKYQMQYAEKEIENQIVATYLQHKNTKAIYEKFTEEMLKQMEDLSTNARINFDKRNISLIEYIDHQRAYIDYQMNLIDATSSYYQSINQIHFAVGKEIAF